VKSICWWLVFGVLLADPAQAGDARWSEVHKRNDEAPSERRNTDEASPPDFALRFVPNRTDDVRIPRLIANDFTLEYWIRTSQQGDACNCQWYSFSGVVDAETPNVVNDFGTSLGRGRIWFGTGNPDRTISSGPIGDGLWHHVAATRTRSNGQLRLYIDGVQVAATTAGTQSLVSPPGIAFGRMQTGYGSMDGDLDDVRIWDRALTAVEVATAFASCAIDPQSPGLVGYYRFDEGISGTVHDWSPSGAHGVVRGAPTWLELSLPVSSPQITYAPTSQTVCPSGTAQFRVAVLNTGSASYLWQFEDSGGIWLDVPDAPLQYGGGTVAADANDAPSMNVTCSLIRDAPPIRFRCVVTNACGSVTSPIATLMPCLADLTCDNLVGDEDFVVFAAAYNLLDCADPAMESGCPADLNGDGLVDDGDFVQFVAAYNNLGCIEP